MISEAIQMPITDEILFLCNRIEKEATVWNVPWPKSSAYEDFKKVHGTTHRKSSIKTIGCYLLSDGHNNTYVGKSTHISSRIRNHLLKIHRSTRSAIESMNSEKAKITIYLVNKKIADELLDMSISVETFLIILEQYLMITCFFYV